MEDLKINYFRMAKISIPIYFIEKHCKTETIDLKERS